MNEKHVLELEGITKRFPGVLALDEVSFACRSGRITGLIGVNGAGKSTLMNALGGIYPADSGEIRIDGESAKIRSPKDAERRGIAFIHQEPVMFFSMTVAENIFISDLKRKKSGIIDYKQMNVNSKKYLNMLDSDIDPRTRLSDVAIGDRQIIEIVRALAIGARIVLFDEPTSSLSYKEKDKLFNIIRSLRDQGVIVIYISHFLDEIEALCDDVIVLRNGKKVLAGIKGEITRKDIIGNMIGGQVAKFNEEKWTPCDNNPVALKVENLSRPPMVRKVSFEIKEGEIVGIWGLMGSGRTELLRAVAGLDKKTAGAIYLTDGRGGLKRAKKRQILDSFGYVTENRHYDGLLLPLSVSKNIAEPNLKMFQKKPFGFLDKKREEAVTEEFAEKLSVKTPSVHTPVRSLSGGNQQKAILAKWVLKQPGIFMMDEPTRGVDVGAKAEIHNLILRLREEGSAILLVSSEIEEISLLSDRVLVLNRGTIVKEIGRGSIEKDYLMSFCV